MTCRFWSAFRGERGAMAGLVTLAVLVALSLAAPAIAPQDPADPLGFDPLAANHPPALSWTYLLGADARGRSVLALLLWGGRTSLAIGVGAALLAAFLGLLLGALACWPGRADTRVRALLAGLLDLVLSRLMDVCQAAPPLLVLLILAGQLGGVPAPLILVTFALTGWVAPARLTRAGLLAGRRAPYVEAARAVGVGEARIIVTHLLPSVLAPVAAWVASSASIYVALEAGLDFLGLGLPQGTTSWGTALAGAQDALAMGNWWWMTFGGLALAAATLSLGAIARGLARALDPVAAWTHVSAAGAASAASVVSAEREGRVGAPVAPVQTAPRESARQGRVLAYPAHEPLPALAEVCARPALRPTQRSAAGGRTRTRVSMAAVASTGLLALAAIAGTAAASRSAAPHLPTASALLRQARDYPLHGSQRFAYIATATYVATRSLLDNRQVPWAARQACPLAMDDSPDAPAGCAGSTVQLWSSAGRVRAFTEGITFVCGPHRSWAVNPMAGIAWTRARSCGPLGPLMGGLGATAGAVRSLLPTLAPAGRQGSPLYSGVLGRDAVAGRTCWVVALPPDGRACIDAATGLTLEVERLDRAGTPVALFQVSAISYGLDLAPELFANPIPGGHGPLISGLTQPLLTIQAADDVALFVALVPTFVPSGLVAQTPTYDSFYDAARGYAQEDRVRQAYTDRAGRVALVLIETVPGSDWDITPPRRQARRVVFAGRRLLVWAGRSSEPALVRVTLDGTDALISSRVLPLHTLERVAIGLQ